MQVGITGTRSGMTPAQKTSFVALVGLERDMTGFHHGKCVGVDCEAGEIVRGLSSARVVLHPPVKTDLEGEAEGDEERPRKGYFARNRCIVDEVDLLVVVPFQSEWQSQGGTWYTHDYAIKRGKPVVIIWPDGSIEVKDASLSGTATPESTSASR